MSAIRKTAGFTVAAAAAALFAAGSVAIPASPSHAAELVACHGVNACKGHSACATANSACAGHNACKGQGFVMMSAEACEQVGGKT